MSLSESRALTGVDPWLAIRVKWLGDVINAWGGVQIYLSGVRTRAEQERLFETVRRRPVAPPGCSQHEYGYAVDVAWGLLREESPIGHFSPAEINNLMGGLGKRVGLVTVERDAGHFQIFPGSEFRAWAVASRLCSPNQKPIMTDGWTRLPSGTLVNASPDFLRICRPTSGGIICDYF